MTIENGGVKVSYNSSDGLVQEQWALAQPEARQLIARQLLQELAEE